MHPKKNSQNSPKMCTKNRTNIWKIVSKNMKQIDKTNTHKNASKKLEPDQH
jgi:hypothetical protein